MESKWNGRPGRTSRVLRRGGALVVAVSLGGLTGGLARASALEDEVPPRAWAEQVCATAGPAIRSSASSLAALDSVPAGPIQSINDLTDRVQMIDKGVAGMTGVLTGMRDGIVDADVPSIPHGRRVMKTVTHDLDRVIDGLGQIRDTFALVLEDSNNDLEAAAQRIQEAVVEHLSRAAFGDLAAHWPRALTRAMNRTPDCRVLVRILEDSTATV